MKLFIRQDKNEVKMEIGIPKLLDSDRGHKTNLSNVQVTEFRNFLMLYEVCYLLVDLI